MLLSIESFMYVPTFVKSTNGLISTICKGKNHDVMKRGRHIAQYYRCEGGVLQPLM